MPSVSHPPLTFTWNLATGISASDLLHCSSNGVVGVPLKSLGRAQFGATTRDFALSAKKRKGKKYEDPIPWSNVDPNDDGEILRAISPFKPLKEEQKPVILDFEKPLVNLQKKIMEVQKMANETGLDFTGEMKLLEEKYQQALKDLYSGLEPIERVHIARHPHRPTTLDHVFDITENFFIEFHGDRAGYDDPAIVTGLGRIDGRNYMFMGHQKGRNAKESIQRNFGMPTTHGYRKALRMMYQANQRGIPIITFIDTPGAFTNLKCEGDAIAQNLRTMFGLRVPIISIVIGEGGSGGVLPFGCANKLLMLQNAVFAVASPEACGSTLYKSAKESPKAAKKIRITAQELCELKIADGIIQEPLGGAHADSHLTSQRIKSAITETMDELLKMDTQELLQQRRLKFRNICLYQEGIPVPIKKEEGIPVYPKRRVTVRRREKPTLDEKIEKVIPINDKEKPISKKKEGKPILKRGKTSAVALEGEVERLKQQILNATQSSTDALELDLNEMISKLKEEVKREFSKAAKFMGLKDNIMMLRKEFAKARNSKDQPVNLAIKDKMVKLVDEFNQGLHAAPNYESLKYKLDMLNELSEAKNLSEKNAKQDTLRKELGHKLIKELKLGMEELHREINHVAEGVANSSDLMNKIKEVKLVVEKAGRTPPDLESKNKIWALEREMKRSIAEAINSSGLKEKHEKLEAEIEEQISEAIGSNRGLNGSLVKGNMEELIPRVMKQKRLRSIEQQTTA
ncbi:hypothetical protein RHGRI_015385 [Rhododendron griersonianum]|uniref:acetyl-CoA carboxytransferase n=1 Tax=Rhododendron griersonianum TaxID=479676 RepID=A0AAV6KDL9_9ERIC|nr:hypothetical protein RHGRI_015385 [Rhododendron griersonianum]